VSIKVWYQVRDLAAACGFYTEALGFEAAHTDETWMRLVRGPMEIGIAQGEPRDEGGVATIDVDDVKAEAERLRAAGHEVGVVVELHGQMRLLDVFDPDGNRIQLAQVLGEPEPAV
jgi:catechol 2,3-dioxygenase-like lactoylglutathione lyase family enzyme